MITPVNANDFKTLLQAQRKPMLVDFYATWCGPCKMQAPVLERINQKFGENLLIAKVNIDEEQQLAQEYEVMSFPTLILFKNGQAVRREVGFVPEETLLEILKEEFSL